MDSLRYWATEMHVDGFRFDLCTTLARENGDYSQGSAFFDAVRQDPVMTGLKLIAEPWDLGPYGYQLGNFPPGWAEWNAQYRDTLRRFWKGDQGLVADVASRVAGSSDIFGYRGRRPWASINFITAHDGFTLQDLVSYNEKHNEANGEDNRDGNDSNLQLELRGRRAVRRPRDRRPARSAKAQHAGEPAVVARGADAARRRRDRAQPAGQQQRLLPRQRNLLDRLGEHPARGRGDGPVRQLSDPSAPRASGVLAAAVSARRGALRGRGQGHHLVHPVGEGSGRRGLDQSGGVVAWVMS